MRKKTNKKLEQRVYPIWGLMLRIFGIKITLNLYPPFSCMGISIVSHSPDYTSFQLKMKPHWYNRNLTGSNFGATLFTMSDPFPIFILSKCLGDSYIFWDQDSKIEFLKPSNETVYASFQIQASEIMEIKRIIQEKRKMLRIFEFSMCQKNGIEVAKITKTVYIRRKPQRKSTGKS